MHRKTSNRHRGRSRMRRVLTYRVSVLNSASAVMTAAALGLFVGLVTS